MVGSIDNAAVVAPEIAPPSERPAPSLRHWYDSGAGPDTTVGGARLYDLLMEPTRIYVKPVLALMDALPVKGLAHITGGGLTGNVPRVLPAGTTAVIDRQHWPLPPLFQWLQREGNVADAEMHRVFNCGIGMVVIVAPEHEKLAVELLGAAGETVFELGRIEACGAGDPQTVIL